MKRLRGVIAWGFFLLGLLVMAVELVSASVLAVIVATVVVAVPFGFLMSSFNRPLLETSLGLALPVRAVVSPIGPSAVLRRHWPWLVAVGVVLVVVTRLTGTATSTIMMGYALWQYREARWLGRWQDDHGVEVLLPVQSWRESRGFYLRPAPFSGRSLPESVRKPPRN